MSHELVRLTVSCGEEDDVHFDERIDTIGLCKSLADVLVRYDDTLLPADLRATITTILLAANVSTANESIHDVDLFKAIAAAGD